MSPPGAHARAFGGGRGRAGEPECFAGSLSSFSQLFLSALSLALSRARALSLSLARSLCVFLSPPSLRSLPASSASPPSHTFCSSQNDPPSSLLPSLQRFRQRRAAQHEAKQAKGDVAVSWARTHVTCIVCVLRRKVPCGCWISRREDTLQTICLSCLSVDVPRFVCRGQLLPGCDNANWMATSPRQTVTVPSTDMNWDGQAECERKRHASPM